MKQYLFLLYFISILGIAQNVAISTDSVFDGEPHLAVNPQDSNHLIIAWMGFTNVSQRIQIKTRSSFDGGTTWQPTVSLEHAASGYTSADPSIAFDENGNIVIAYIDFTGTDSDPIFGGIYISKSTDNGATFSPPIEVLNISVMPDQKIIDRPWLQIDVSNGPNQGAIYVSSMNAKDSEPPFRPYLSVSTNGGNSFTLQSIDDTGWLSGNFITQPMPTPSVSSNGIFYAVYPSFVLSQSVLPQYIIASSTNAGQNYSYNTVIASSDIASKPDPLPKKGYLLISNPTNEDHLGFIYLSKEHEDLDVFFTETLDAGTTWSTPIRMNDDPIANGRMQDLLWGDFNNEGDLIVSWRDRRNAPSTGYETDSEIWATYKPNGAVAFEPNFQITDQSIPYNDILASAGNDFMNVQLEANIVHTTWGDPRTNLLKIWYQKTNTDGSPLGISEITSEAKPPFYIYPNPANEFVIIESDTWNEIYIYSQDGRKVYAKTNTTNERQL